MTTSLNSESVAQPTRFLVVFASGTPPTTLFTDKREIRIETLSSANVLATDSHEAIALATEATSGNNLSALAALTVNDLKAMAEALERFPFTDVRRVGYTLKDYATAEQYEHAVVQHEDAAVFKS